jgi:hypothetical protein
MSRESARLEIADQRPEWSERDPSGKPANAAGSKLDAGKAPIFRGVINYFPNAIVEVAKVSGFGAEKYTWNGWESVPDGVNRYSDAMGRHLIGETIDGPTDPATGLSHAAQVAWNALARLELMLREQKK